MLFIAFFISIIINIIFCLRLGRKRDIMTNRFLLMFISLGAWAMMIFMGAHIGVNVWLYVQSMINGSFHYSFDVYANLEFAALFFCLSLYIFQQIRLYAFGNKKAGKKYFIAVIIQLFLCVTLIPVNTTSTIPAVLYSVSLIAFG